MDKVLATSKKEAKIGIMLRIPGPLRKAGWEGSREGWKEEDEEAQILRTRGWPLSQNQFILHAE